MIQIHDNSYGFRPNRCAEQAIRKTLELLNQHYTWIVDIDLEKFFDTVDHDSPLLSNIMLNELDKELEANT